MDRLIVEEAQHIGRERAGRVITAIAVLIQGFHDDPVQLAAKQLAEPFRVALAVDRNRSSSCLERANPRAGSGRFLLADDPPDFIETCLAQLLSVERRGAS